MAIRSSPTGVRFLRDLHCKCVMNNQKEDDVMEISFVFGFFRDLGFI
jgi:hypothetical protein